MIEMYEISSYIFKRGINRECNANFFVSRLSEYVEDETSYISNQPLCEH